MLFNQKNIYHSKVLGVFSLLALCVTISIISRILWNGNMIADFLSGFIDGIILGISVVVTIVFLFKSRHENFSNASDNEG